MIRSSIRNKLVVFLLVATIIPIAASIVITYFLTNSRVTDEAVASSSRLLAQGAVNMTNYLNTINKASLAVYNIEQGSNFFDILKTGTADFESEREITRTMQKIYYAVSETEQVYMYVAKSNLSYAVATDRSFKRLGHTANEPPRGLALGGAYIEPPHPGRSYSDAFFPRANVLSLHRSLYDVPAKDDLGLLTIDFNSDVIDSICRQLFAEKAEELYVLDERGAVVFSPDPQQLGTVLNNEWVRQLQAEEAEAGHFRWKGKGFSGVHVYEKMTTPYMQWTIVKRIPFATLSANARELTLINSLVYSMFLLVAIVATVYISVHFTKPIKKLIGYIHRIQSGSLNVAIDVGGHDEFGILARRFADMMRTINNLILREYRLELANRTNELKALQAQINPHFLNNALQSIGTLALQQEQRKIYSLISSLGKMMRYGMDTSESVVPLAKEIDYVQAYVDLQKQRFEDQLRVDIALDPEALAVRVPKLIVQPLVENYFKHGYNRETREGELAISCCIEGGEWLRIEVRDNGHGVTAEQLASLRQRLRREEDGGGEPAERSIGLANVQSRLALFYNDNARMEVDRVEPHGFCVTLRIPLAGPGRQAE